MQDDDWMFPQRLHSPSLEEPEDLPATPQVQIDPELIRKRLLRKQKLSPQPNSMSSARPWSALDQKIGDAYPKFSDGMWSLGDTARWVIERTPEAVNGLSIDESKLLDIRSEIHAALSAGEISAFAHTAHDPVPRELPSETWAVYDLFVEKRNGFIRVLALNSAPSDDEQHLLNLRLRRDGVLQRWPDPSKRTPPIGQTTRGAENQCRRWLVTMMKEATAPRPKAEVWKAAAAKFPNLGKRGFDRAWGAAIREANADRWGAPGRRAGKIESPQ